MGTLAKCRHMISQDHARTRSKQTEAIEMWKVSYIHLKGYRVSRTFDTQEAAQEFIDVNAMVCPLPGVRLEEM